MLKKLPKVIRYTSFEKIGFYDYIYMKECILKSMKKNLVTFPEMPGQLPTRQSLVGIFHHKLMEHIFTVNSKQDLELFIEEKIVEIQEIVDSFSHLRKSGTVSGWDEINISASLTQKLYRDLNSSYTAGKLGLEHELNSLDGSLTGRPDFFYIKNTKAILREFKTSSLRNEAREVRDEYIEQIKFYALLIFDSFDISEIDATLESSRGEYVTYSLTKNDVEAIRVSTSQSFKNANQRIEKAKVIEELATANTMSCQNCDKRILCNRFKNTQYAMDLDGDSFVLDGIAEGCSVRAGGQLFEINIKETLNGHHYSLILPSTKIDQIKLGKNYIFSDLFFHNGKFRWSERSRAFVSE